MNNPGYCMPWPSLTGDLVTLATPSSVVTAMIGKTVHPEGTNCGRDAYRVVRHLHAALAGETNKIHLQRTDGSWSWKGKGLGLLQPTRSHTYRQGAVERSRPLGRKPHQHHRPVGKLDRGNGA